MPHIDNSSHPYLDALVTSRGRPSQLPLNPAAAPFRHRGGAADGAKALQHQLGAAPAQQQQQHQAQLERAAREERHVQQQLAALGYSLEGFQEALQNKASADLGPTCTLAQQNLQGAWR